VDAGAFRSARAVGRHGDMVGIVGLVEGVDASAATLVRAAKGVVGVATGC
jgi:hypothetical protein